MAGVKILAMVVRGSSFFKILVHIEQTPNVTKHSLQSFPGHYRKKKWEE